MKMSDALELPVVQNQSRLFKHVVYSEKSDVVAFSCHNNQIAQHACHAINNHDRLTEENAKLREFIEKQIPFLNSVSAQKAQQLLTKLKEQTNDK